jgi:hypothetical protein
MKNSTKVHQESKKNAAKSLGSGSTKATSSLMDQGFLSQGLIVSKDKKAQIRNNSSKLSKKNNLYDLQRTLDINIEILKNYFKNTTSTMTLLNQDKQILDKLDKFIIKYNKKKDIIKKIKEIKSKNLIQSQIFFESKRKLQETLNNCKESLLDNEDAVNNKDEYVKLFQKKFVEVEIYLKRITSDMRDEKRKKYYQNYKMDVFTNLNTTLNKKKETLIEDINKYKTEKKKLKNENKKIKKEEKIFMNEEEKREKEKLKDDEISKRKNEIIINKYKKYIKNKTSKINRIKNFMKRNCNIDMLLNKNNEINKINNIEEVRESIINDSNDENKKKIKMFKKIDPKKNKNNNIRNNEIKEDDENEKSILPYEMTKRMNSFMDFSIILNDNSNIKESAIRQKNVSRIAWGDVSAIEKNDDF